MFTGRSTLGMLLSGLVLPGTNARSGMNDPNGTFMKRLLSISHAEQIGCWACAAAPNRHASAAITAVQANLRIRNALFLIAFLPTARLSFLIEIGLRLALYPLIRLPPSAACIVPATALRRRAACLPRPSHPSGGRRRDAASRHPR